MATPVVTIDLTGIHKPDFATELQYFTDRFQAIFGSDIYIAPDSQDGQFIGLLALAIDDCNNAAIAAYNSFSPGTALGTGLSRVVKINGLTRSVPTRSTVPVLITGVAGAVINSGIVEDINGNDWDLPAVVTVPLSGQITVTATAVDLGAITASENTVTGIGSPTYGWQSVNNLSEATPGAPVESDASLRIRQTQSTSLPTRTVLDGIIGAILEIPNVNVNRVAAYSNDTNIPDENGLPGHSIALVVDGGDATLIAQTIAIKKAPTIGTFGSTTIPITDAYGVTRNIAFSTPDLIDITFKITVRALPGFTLDVVDLMKSSLVAWVNALPIGAEIFLTRTYMPIQFNGGIDSSKFELVAVTVARDDGTPVVQDIDLEFDEAPFTSVDFIDVTVT